MVHDCDLCGSSEAIEVPHAREYTGDQPIHICAHCGFVHVKDRRSAQEIAASWSTLYDGVYKPQSPAVIARLTYVAETINQQIGIFYKSVCDIGAGDGAFLEIARGMGAKPFGIEPSAASARLPKLGIPYFLGTIEDYADANKFDIVTINWTLENCSDCIAMLRAARRLLKPDGRLVVATGSRILVPPRKPLWHYLGPNPADTHAFRFSANSLMRAMNRAGFFVGHLNSFIDSDVLLAIGKALPEGSSTSVPNDDPQAVADFFARWHEDTCRYFPRSK